VTVVRAVPPPRHGPDAELVVSQALLPLLAWRGVAVLREQRVELTVLERFVLELALTLGSVEPEDFTEVTSLPSSVLSGATWRLVSSGTLAPQGASYSVDPERAAAALREQAVTRRVRGQASFALLPRTGDLFAVAEPDGGWLRDLEQKIAPHRQAPLPPSLWSQSLASYLGERIADRSVVGLDRAVVDVAPREDDPPLGEPVPAGPADRSGEAAAHVCPAYLCHAELRRGDTGIQVVRASAFGKPRRGGPAPGSAQPDDAEIEIDLTAARELAARWADLAGALDDPETLRNAWLELSAATSGPDGVASLAGAERRGLGTWDLLVDSGAATLLCGQPRPLPEPRGLALESDEAVVHLTCRFFPADDTARALFARDDLITRLLAAQQSAAVEFTAACDAERRRHPAADAILSGESVRERVWQLGHYHLAYLLREQEDFCYD
jgi:hypothetical protein